MKKIVSNLLIVSTQLIVGGLFLFMLFSDSNEDNRVVVIENNNLDKMADAVSELFVVDHAVAVDEKKEEELIDAEQKRLEEEAQAKAQAEAEAKAAAELAAQQAAEAARIAQEEANRKAQEEAARNAVVVDASGYISKPAIGFNVTTGNRTYSLSDDQFAIVAAVVSCEANKSSVDDILGVMSVILNRADKYGTDPVSVVAAPYQFSCYTGNGIVPSDTVAKVMRDALGGIRNNQFLGFNSWYSTSYSDNYIAQGGNRYR